MLLGDATSSLRLTVTGYQFPLARDLTKRYSRHMIEGEALVPDGAWRFRHAALTCEETPMVAMWLTTVADWLDGGPEEPPPGPAELAPPVLRFSQPNLSFRTDGPVEAGQVVIAVDLDREFKPPWRRTADSSHYTVRLLQAAGDLRRASATWVREIARYPDGLEQLANGAEAD